MSESSLLSDGETAEPSLSLLIIVSSLVVSSLNIWLILDFYPDPCLFVCLTYGVLFRMLLARLAVCWLGMRTDNWSGVHPNFIDYLSLRVLLASLF